ncbi:hypothetical protein AB4Z52_30820 [Rhizobium sp. 2YAF20]|uniref:hypothetical protein n=1 Tax=Rhizobium sp. 2YAF20 TaxID=3233027 RepID=UPI003F94B85E
MIKPNLFLVSAYAPGIVAILITTVLGMSMLSQANTLGSSLIFSLPFISSVVLPPLFSRILRSVSDPAQTKIQFASRTCFYLAAGCCLTSLNVHSGLTFVFYGLVLIVASLDQVLTSVAPVFANAVYGYSYTRSSALANILGRAAQGITPLVAGSFSQHSGGGIFFIALLVVAGLSFYYPMRINAFDAPTKQGPTASRSGGFDVWAIWFMFYNFLINFSQGAVSFLLLAVSPGLRGPALNGTLYATFLCVQIALLFSIGPKTWLEGNLGKVLALSAVNGCLIVVLGFAFSTQLAYVLVAIIGIAYGLSIPLFSDAIFKKLKGPRLKEYLSYGKSSSRVASSLSIWGAGIALTSNITPSHLLSIYGALLLGSCLILLLFASTLNRDKEEDPTNRQFAPIEPGSATRMGASTRKS